MRTVFAIAAALALFLTGCDDGSTDDETDIIDTVDDPIVDPLTGEVIFLHMVHVEKGSFMMGQNGDGTIGNNASSVREVTLTKDFYIGKYEVTQAQWKAVMGETLEERQLAAAPTQSTNYGRGDEYPMYYVNWYHTIVFCNKLSIMEGFTPAFSIDGKTDPAEWGEVPTSTTHASYATWKDVEIIADSTGYRLPSEAQWEYAAKGGHLASDPYYIFSGSNRIGIVAWNYWNNGTSGTELFGAKQVGTKQANELGIHDMAGNVQEWCLDNMTNAGSLPVGDEDPLKWNASGNDKQRRGGYWNDTGSCRSVGSSFANLNVGVFFDGFRVVRPVTQ